MIYVSRATYVERHSLHCERAMSVVRVAKHTQRETASFSERGGPLTLKALLHVVECLSASLFSHSPLRLSLRPRPGHQLA